MQKEDSIKTIFKNVIGQNTAIQFLKAALEKKQIAPAYLFIGPEGIGKKLTAVKFAEGLLRIKNKNNNLTRKRLETRNHPDVFWIEPTYIQQGKLITQSKAENQKLNFRSLPQIRVEQIKDIKRFLAQKPVESEFTLIIVENIEMMNEAASNALLKVLEEPGRGIFILITTRPESLLVTILSRCQKIIFNRLSKDLIEQIITTNIQNKTITISEGMKQEELLELAEGSPGLILKNIETWENIPKKLWQNIKKLPHSDPLDALSLAKELTEDLNLQQQLWVLSWIQKYIWEKNSNSHAVKILENLRFQLKSFVNPRLAWEIAFLQIME